MGIENRVLNPGSKSKSSEVGELDTGQILRAPPLELEALESF